MIQVQGLVSETLSKLTFDVSNSSGVLANQPGYWQPVYYDPSLNDFTTNTFQCYDVKLTNGMNTITLHAIDLAGNTATASVNYTLDYSGAVPPVLSIVWPQNGTAVSGSNFTLQAQVDDDTATVTAQITDTHGDTNTVQGLVERSGVVWAQNLPLAAGTSILTVTATNAAGLSASTNLTLVQSSALVTMNPLSPLNQSTVSVTGNISDPTSTLTVNGTNAYYLDDEGDWEADNVPVNPTGTATFDVEVYAGDPAKIGSQHFFVQQPLVVWMKSYDMDYVGSDVPLTVNWTYQGGGDITAYGNVVFGISPLTNGVADIEYLDEYLDAFTPAWEYANVSISAEYLQIQTRVMIEPQSQMPIGTNQLYLVSAAAFGRVDGPDPITYLDSLNASFDLCTGGSSGETSSYGGTWPMPPQWLQINGQTLVDSGQVNCGGADWGETLISAPAGVNVDVTPVATQVSNFWDYSFVVQAANETLQIVDNNTGNVLSGQTNTVIVGQQMNLSCQLSVTNAGLMNSTLSNFQWTVPGYAISNYVANSESGTVYTNFPTTNSSAVFYWVDGATNRSVWCSATIDGVTISNQAVFNVLRPTANLNVFTNGPVVIDNNGSEIEGTSLHWGVAPMLAPATNYGIAFWATNFTLNGCPSNSEFLFVQIGTNQAEHNLTNGTSYRLISVGLDSEYPCGSFLADFAGYSPPYYSDQPEEPANVSVDVWRSDHYSSYLLFEPPYSNSIAVPLKLAQWSWSGIAQTNGAGGWNLISNATAIYNVNVDAGYPTWSGLLNDTNYITSNSWIEPFP
jgi:hypothetical protein